MKRQTTLRITPSTPAQMYRAERAKRCVYIVVSRETARSAAARLAVALGFSAARSRLCAVIVMSGLFAPACGYSSVHTALENTRWCSMAGTSLVPDADAVTAVLEGARAELARHGALANNGEYPCLRVELTRLREAPRGIQAVDGQPVARGLSVEATGRAWLQDAPDAAPSHETGELARIGRAAAGSSAQPNDRAARVQASRNLGIALARSALGLPTPKQEPQELP